MVGLSEGRGLNGEAVPYPSDTSLPLHALEVPPLFRVRHPYGSDLTLHRRLAPFTFLGISLIFPKLQWGMCYKKDINR